MSLLSGDKGRKGPKISLVLRYSGKLLGVPSERNLVGQFLCKSISNRLKRESKY
jgi:hypothetical protein